MVIVTNTYKCSILGFKAWWSKEFQASLGYKEILPQNKFLKKYIIKINTFMIIPFQSVQPQEIGKFNPNGYLF